MRQTYNPIAGLGRQVLDLLLPPSCPVCFNRIGEVGHFCGTCWAGMQHIADPKCERCGLPFVLDGDGPVCAACLAYAPVFRRVFAPVLYDGVGRQAVLALKHGRRFLAAPAMARFIANAVPEGLGHDAVIPVPLHWRRQISRRFNQSQLLGEAVAKKLDLPLMPGAVRRIRATPSQGSLGRRARFKNVRSAFEVKADAKVHGKTLLLVDDVLTTGATASACAAALLTAGAEAVDVVVFARVGEPTAQ